MTWHFPVLQLNNQQETRGWKTEESELLHRRYEENKNILDGHPKSKNIKAERKAKWVEIAKEISAYVLQKCLSSFHP